MVRCLTISVSTESTKPRSGGPSLKRVRHRGGPSPAGERDAPHNRRQHVKKIQFLRTGVASAVALACAQPALATNFDIADGWTGSWNSSLSLGSSWRARKQDSRLYGQADGALVGRTDGTGANAVDEGELNYNKGDRYTTQLKLFSEIEVKKDDFGFLLRGKAWYDEALKDENVHYGNQHNGYNGYDLATDSLGSPKPLSDAGFERLARFS